MVRAKVVSLASKPLEPAAINPAHRSYLKDASSFSGTAEKIFFPCCECEEEVSSLLKEARRSKTPVTISGAGTGLTRARVPQGASLLSTERMNRILSIRWNKRSSEGRVVVQPGVTLNELEKALDERGLFYPPNPGEKAASIGGTIATNASGSRSFKYGPTRRWVERLKIILPNGDLLECRRGEVHEKNGLFEIDLSDGTTARIPVPNYRMPVCKNAAGYHAFPGMDLIDLFIGAEGTLGVVTEVELTVLKKPTALFSGILFFPDEKSCYRFSRETLPGLFDLRVLEFFDSRSLTLLREKHPDIPPEASAALYFEHEWASGQEPSAMPSWVPVAKILGPLAAKSWISSDPKRQNEFRIFRYDLPVSVNELVAKNGFQKVGTDLAVPSENGEVMFDFYLSTLGGCGIDYCLFGHLGENHLHANLFPKTPEQFQKALGFYRMLAEKAVALGGTVSAEHGIGKMRIPYLEMMVGKEGLKQMARVKRALDPEGILNPGNIIPVELLRES